MKTTAALRACAATAFACVITGASAQVTSDSLAVLAPNTGPSPAFADVGGMRFSVLGLQGVGRVDATDLDLSQPGIQYDAFGETFGSISSMQIGTWRKAGDAYVGSFYTLPDRGYNAPDAGYFSAYAGRIQQLNFTFTPYTSSAPLGGTTVAERVAAQNQIRLSYAGGIRFSYLGGDGIRYTTGLDPATPAAGGVPLPLFGSQVPQGYTPGSSPVATGLLALDAEGLALKADGSGYVSDEYGPNIYHFNSAKELIGVLPLPAALEPRTGGELNFASTVAPQTGRRNNQGMEGIALSPDGTKLYALMQSATVQDTNGSQQQTRNNVRLLVYDLTGGPVPTAPAKELVLQLPVYDFDPTNATSAVDRTAAQSEIVALDDGKILVLSRDGIGLGVPNTTPTMFKSVLLVDTESGTDVLGNAAVNAAGGRVSPSGALLPSITPLTWKEALNILDTVELARFNINLNNASKDALTLSEKWEGLSLVSALDPTAPDDYFLFVANDNDFLSTNGRMIGADGTFLPYDAGLNNDTLFLAYRVRIAPVPEPASVALMIAGLAGLGVAVRRRRVRTGS